MVAEIDVRRVGVLAPGLPSQHLDAEREQHCQREHLRDPRRLGGRSPEHQEQEQERGGAERDLRTREERRQLAPGVPDALGPANQTPMSTRTARPISVHAPSARSEVRMFQAFWAACSADAVVATESTT